MLANYDGLESVFSRGSNVVSDCYMILKDKRWRSKKYTDWVAKNMACANCTLQDETIVSHHLKHRYFPYSGGGTGMKADDFLVMPLCYTCHDKAHNGDNDVLDWQAEFIFKTLTMAFREGILIVDDTRC